MVKLYSVRRNISGLAYEDVVCAESWEDADVLAEKLGGEVSGQILSEEFVSDEELSAIFHSGTPLAKSYTDGY